jgi:hypothetical protein
MVRLLNLTFYKVFRNKKFDPGFEMKQLVYGPNGFGPKESKRVSPEVRARKRAVSKLKNVGIRRLNLERPDHQDS